MCRETWREDPAERVRKAVANYDLCILSSFFFLLFDEGSPRFGWDQGPVEIMCIMSRCIRGYGELQSRREFYGI